MELNCERAEGLLVVTVPERRLDAAVAIQFRDAMRALTEDAPARVVLDLEAVDFLDSSGLGSVIGAMKQLGQDRKLELAALSPAVEKVFRLTRMDRIFTIHRNSMDAMKETMNAG